jgi:hypothetical protein
MRRNESTFELELPIVEQRWARFAAAPDAVQARFEALVTEHGEAEDVAQAFRRFVSSGRRMSCADRAEPAPSIRW